MSISTEEKDRYLRETAIVLAREGFQTGKTDTGKLRVLLDGAPLCEVTENGGITYRNEDITVTMGAAHPTCIPCSKAAEKRSPPPREDCAHLMDPGEVRDGPPRRTHSIGDLIQRNRTSKKAWSL